MKRIRHSPNSSAAGPNARARRLRRKRAESPLGAASSNDAQCAAVAVLLALALSSCAGLQRWPWEPSESGKSLRGYGGPGEIRTLDLFHTI